MSYNKRTSIRATRGEEMTFDELHGSKLKALINMAIALVISFSLVIAFTPLASVSSAFADPTEDPETPGITCLLYTSFHRDSRLGISMVLRR